MLSGNPTVDSRSKAIQKSGIMRVLDEKGSE